MEHVRVWFMWRDAFMLSKSLAKPPKNSTNCETNTFLALEDALNDWKELHTWKVCGMDKKNYDYCLRNNRTMFVTGNIWI